MAAVASVEAMPKGGVLDTGRWHCDDVQGRLIEVARVLRPERVLY